MSVLERMERQAVILGRRNADMLDLELIENVKRAGRDGDQWAQKMAGLRNSGVPIAADGFLNTRPPYNGAAFAAITLAATAKMLWPAAGNSPIPGAAGWWWVGKEVRVRAYGTMTTGTTPGNLTASIAYGTADNTGLLASSAALTLIASQTTIPWIFDAYYECRGVGASGAGGSIFAWGQLIIGAALVAAGGGLVPASAPAAVNVDTSANSGVNLQFARSGSTAETATTQDLIVQELN